MLLLLFSSLLSAPSRLRPLSPHPEPLARVRNRLLEPQAPKQQVLDGQHDEEDAVAVIREDDDEEGHAGIEVVVVRRGDDGDEDVRGVPDAEEGVEDGPGARHAALAGFEDAAEQAGVVQQRAADAEGVAEVHRGHGRQGVDVLALHPHRLPVVVAHAVEEAVLRRQQARRHARVEDEDGECHQVRERHRPAHDGERVVRGRNVVVPGDEPVQGGWLAGDRGA